jgi:Holliday junction resolvasome RuvABC ATP-dependent DNA helicase subunit
VQDFVGREWLTAKVDAFLNDEKRKSEVLLLVGEAGFGKTLFLGTYQRPCNPFGCDRAGTH